MLLWALLSASPATAPLNPQSTIRNPQFIRGDSLIFHDLKAKLDRRQKEIAPEKLYLQLDRTLYQPGETAWFSAYVRNAGDLLPSLQSQILYVELLDPRGAIVQQKTVLALFGVAAGEFDFPADVPGGLYKIKAYTHWMQNTSEVFERTLTLQKVVLPRLNLKLEFERKAFGPGDVAIARFDAFSLDNQALAHREIGFTAAASGRQFAEGQAQTDVNGRAYLRFQLPENLESADGLLNIQIEHNGQTEAISRAIPIVLNKIDLQFFPEGGDAVAGLPCRMAFKAVNEFGKPADVEGLVFDSHGVEVAAFSSYHHGMGAFDFVPIAGEHYEARLTKPFSSEKTYALPEIQKTGYGLRLQERDADKLTFEVSAKRPGKAWLVGQSRDKLFFFSEINFETNNVAKVVVPVKNLPIGIARFTLFDKNKDEQAERLVFLHRDKGLKIEIQTDKSEYLPREKAGLSIRVTDHAGRPVQGNFSLAVTDENLLTFADDKQGHLVASLLLKQDVKGRIEEPNFYFDPAEPRSGQALDYLLMTQGWRRFAWKEVMEGQAVAYQYAPERAAIAGQLLRPNGKPWKDTEVSLYPNGPSVKTDKDGRYSFQNVDIQQYSHLKYWGEYKPLFGYSDNFVFRAMSGPMPQQARIYRQANAGNATVLQGRVMDENGEPLIGATVKVLKGSDFVRGTITDFDGNYRITPLDPGTYNLEISYTGYASSRVAGVKVLDKQNTAAEIMLGVGPTLEEVSVKAFIVPLIEQDKTQAAQTITADQIRNLPTRNVNAVVATTAGTKTGEGVVRDDDEVVIVTGGAVADLQASEIVAFKVPIIQMDNMETGQTLTREQLEPRSFADRSVWAGAEKKKIASRPYPARPAFVRARQFYVPQYDTLAQQPAQRSDFRSTIYWNPNIQTDSKGEARVEFFTSDAITNFRATLEGIGAQGEVGRAEHNFFVQKPVGIAVKVPHSVIAGDTLQLHIAVSNKTKFPSGGHLSIAAPGHFSLNNEIPPAVQLAAGETKVITVQYAIGQQKTADSPSTLNPPPSTLSIRFSADENVLDAFETTIRTLDRGFPVRLVAGGAAAQNMFNIRLNEPVPGTVSATLTAYPNALEDVLKGMERMMRQPSGCFEQVSSSNYPNLLVLDLLRQTGTAKPEVESRATTLLEDGYKKLTAYECKSGGFDWWGRDPAHEGLTAYGILEFTDMAKVFDVDKKLIDRTVQWMLSRRDGKGGWQVNPHSLHGWQKDGVLDAYIAWTLAEAGYGQQFSAEIERAHEQAMNSNDPYQQALLANALLAMNDPRGHSLISHLRDRQQDDGSWTGTTHSVLHAQGKCFSIETTALVALALMKSGAKTAALQKAMDYIIQSKNEYGYGSTQSTVLALKALVEYAKTGNRSAADGTLVVMVDGRRVAEQAYSTKDPKRIEIRNLEQFFTNNNPRLEVFFENTNAVVPFDLEIRYASRQPRNAANCPIAFQTTLDQNTARIGETVRLSAVLENTSAETQASPMVVLGTPAGLTLQPWQLKQLIDEKKCDFYELWDGFAVFHFEKLAAGESRALHLDLRADIAGTFEAPASQAFLYYSNDQRVWSKPERVVIK